MHNSNPMIKECALNNQEHILFHSRFATALRIMIIIIIVIRIHLSAMEMNWLYCWKEPKFLLCCACRLCVISLSILIHERSSLQNCINRYFSIHIILPYTIRKYITKRVHLNIWTPPGLTRNYRCTHVLLVSTGFS